MFFIAKHIKKWDENNKCNSYQIKSKHCIIYAVVYMGRVGFGISKLFNTIIGFDTKEKMLYLIHY